MKKTYYLLPMLCFLGVSCKTIKVNEDNYAWKSFDDTEPDQRINLSEYASPNDRPGQNPDKLIIFCASGGGSRAAAFNMGIMLELETIYDNSDQSNIDKECNVLNEIDYFSTVSGGGWGISSFIAYKYQKNKYSSIPYLDAISKYNSSLISEKAKKKEIEPFPTYNSYEKYLANRADFRYFKHQIPLLFTFGFGAKKSDQYITNRMNAGYLGWSYRADVEEKIWPFMSHTTKFCTSEVDEIMLGDIFKPTTERALLPMQIANTTNIDNYKLIPFTPDRLKYWGVNAFHHYLGNKVTLSSNNDVADFNNIPMASGIKASGGIPFAITASSFPATKNHINYYLHLQDGGIIDQQAMHSVKSILKYYKDTIPDHKKNRIVFIVDASSTGIENKKKFKKSRAGRLYNLWRVMAPFSTPDSQYALTRERIKLLEDEYNCKVIYLGAEVLLDKSLNYIAHDKTRKIPRRKKKLAEYFYDQYKTVQKDRNGFSKLDILERQLLFEYIGTISTWFASKGSKFEGKILEDNPKSTAKIMFLAGRGVVQLKQQKIREIMYGIK